ARRTPGTGGGEAVKPVTSHGCVTIAPLSRGVTGMAETPAELEARLAGFVLPQTGKPLGKAGSAFTIDSSGAIPQVTLELRFPAERAGKTIVAALEEHCRDLGPVDFDVKWSVETHSVQRSLKPIPGVSNVIAVASGKGG